MDIRPLFLPDRIPLVDEQLIADELHAYDAAPNIQRWFEKELAAGAKHARGHGSALLFLVGLTDEAPDGSALVFDPTMPDIDIDFSDERRDMVFDYLRKKYGEDRVARIGNVSTMQPRGVLTVCGKRLGIPAHDTFALRNVLLEYHGGDTRAGAALRDTIETTEPGAEFLRAHPYASIMYDCEGAASHTSVHAAGVIVAPEPVTNFASVVDGVMQMEKNTAESLNLLKIDALGLRTLGVIEDAGVMTAEELYALKPNDPKVFDVLNSGRYVGIFQMEGAATRRVAVRVPVRSLTEMNHINALCRPGPLGGGATSKYVELSEGIGTVEYAHPILEPYLKTTLGLAIYQEQVMGICRGVGRFSWKDITIIRKAMSKRMGEEFFSRYNRLFNAGAAVDGISEAEGNKIWKTINSFGAYGFNLSHAASYSLIAYWTMYLKAYYPLEYAAALLRKAKDDTQTLEILRELSEEGVRYVPFDVERSAVDWSVQDGVLFGGFKNLVGVGPAKGSALVERRDAGKLTEKDLALIEKAERKFSDLSEARTLWGHLYDEPQQVKVFDEHGIRQIRDLEDQQSAVIIGKIVRKDRRDENESVRIQRRKGKRWTRGNPLFLDMFVVDDSITRPTLLRIGTRDWNRWGARIADRAVDGEDWFLIRVKWLELYSMMSCQKIKCLTRPEILQ